MSAPRGSAREGFPTRLPTRLVAAAAGEQHSLGLKSDGTVWAWGHNLSGQVGDGTTTERQVPVQVKFPVPTTPATAGPTTGPTTAPTAAPPTTEEEDLGRDDFGC